MATAENDPHGKYESQATEAPDPAAETPTRLQEAAAGMAEAQGLEGSGNRKGLEQARECTKPEDGEG